MTSNNSWQILGVTLGSCLVRASWGSMILSWNCSRSYLAIQRRVQKLLCFACKLVNLNCLPLLGENSTPFGGENSTSFGENLYKIWILLWAKNCQYFPTVQNVHGLGPILVKRCGHAHVYLYLQQHLFLLRIWSQLCGIPFQAVAKVWTDSAAVCITLLGEFYSSVGILDVKQKFWVDCDCGSVV